MVAEGYSIPRIESIPASGAVANIIVGQPGQKLRKNSRVRIYATRESASVLLTGTIGGNLVFPQGPVDIETVNGTLPSTDDNLIVEVLANENDEIVIAATNSSVAALEARVLVMVSPVIPGRAAQLI